MNDDASVLDNFQHVARLFPLPNLVFFPQSVQPLHIFEPRYRQMTADALKTDQLLTLVLPRPGWENQDTQAPPIHPIACLGRIVAHHKLPDGRYNLLLRGIARVRILEEFDEGKLYRSARVEVLAERTTSSIPDLIALRRRLEEAILPHFGQGPGAEQMRNLFHGELPLGALCDILAFALPLPVERKQQLLEEVSDDRRAEALLQICAETFQPPKPGVVPRFPPDFSSN